MLEITITGINALEESVGKQKHFTITMLMDKEKYTQDAPMNYRENKIIKEFIRSTVKFFVGAEKALFEASNKWSVEEIMKYKRAVHVDAKLNGEGPDGIKYTMTLVEGPRQKTIF